MGKRKSKPGKQKQTRKKNANSILRSGKHGGGGKRKNHQSKKTIVVGSSKNNDGVCVVPPNNKSKIGNGNDEQQDFRNQMDSLVERSRASEQQEKLRGIRRKQRRRNQRHPDATATATTPAATMGTMKPASFRLSKSTNQLVEETTHQMGQIMGGGGSLARAVAGPDSCERTPVASNVPAPARIRGTTGHKGNRGNPFLALGGSDDDETARGASVPPPPPAPRIRFAPAAFSMGTPRAPPIPATPAPRSSTWLPTETPPTTPTPVYHRLHPETDSAASGLFGTINEEEIEERRYQQQTNRNGNASEHHKEGRTGGGYFINNNNNNVDYDDPDL